MQEICIAFPLEYDQVLQSLSFEDLKLTLLFFLAQLSECLLCMSFYKWEEIKTISYLVVTVIGIISGAIIKVPKEERVVALSDVEDTVIVWHYQLFQVPVSSWPFLKLKREGEDVGTEELVHLNSLFHEFYYVVSEKECRDIVILVLNNMVYHDTHCSQLVVLHSCINSICNRDLLVELAILTHYKLRLGPIEYRKLFLKVLMVALLQEYFN